MQCGWVLSYFWWRIARAMFYSRYVHKLYPRILHTFNNNDTKTNTKRYIIWCHLKIYIPHTFFENYLDSDLHIDTSNAISIGCGDYPHYIVSAGYEDYQVLGSVPLSEEKTYLSCRELCRQRYPSFDFYHKFVNYQSCDCIKMVSETPIKIRTHDAYTFGYAEECISRYLAWL